MNWKISDFSKKSEIFSAAVWGRDENLKFFNPYHHKTKRILKRYNLRHILNFLPWFLGENGNPGYFDSRKFQVFRNFRFFEISDFFSFFWNFRFFFRCCLRARWKFTWKLSVIWNVKIGAYFEILTLFLRGKWKSRVFWLPSTTTEQYRFWW